MDVSAFGGVGYAGRCMHEKDNTEMVFDGCIRVVILHCGGVETADCLAYGDLEVATGV